MTGVLFFAVVLGPGLLTKSMAQGWSFTFQLAYSGNCTVAVSLPTLPNVVLPTKGQCESLRQQILSISESGGGCTVYYTATPCTGSDMATTGQTEPGEVTVNGDVQGKPQFSPHQSQAYEDWARDYIQELKSYGINSLLGKSITPQYPTTGDKKLDAYYRDKSENFNPKTPPKQENVPEEEDVYGVVPIMGSGPMTQEEIDRQRLIKQVGPTYYDQLKSFNNVSPSQGITDDGKTGESFTDKVLNLAKDATESPYATWVGNIADVVGSNAVKAANLLGDPEVTTLSNEQMQAMSPEGTLVVAGAKTVAESAIGAVTDQAVKAVDFVGEKVAVSGCKNVNADVVKMDYNDGLDLGRAVMDKTKSVMSYWGLISNN